MTDESFKDKHFILKAKTAAAVLILVFFITADLVTGKIFIPYNDNSLRIPHNYYHHDLKPDKKALSFWGHIGIDLYTNSLGFKDSSNRKVSLETGKRRFLFMGDSFIEGRAVAYEKTVTGLLDKRLDNIEILNAAVSSYSPKLYYLKTKYLIEKVKLSFSDLFVCIDISDIADELIYKDFVPGSISKTGLFIFNIKKYLKENSYLFYSLSRIFKTKQFIEFDSGIFPGLKEGYNLINDNDFFKQRAEWTLEEDIYNDWGKVGLKSATEQMTKLKDLCQENNINLHVVIYPWPNQIYARDLDSIQVKQWTHFCKTYNLGLINLFPDFINDIRAEEIYQDYFIDGDVHWILAGHKYVSERVFFYLQ
ncbi:MAG: hypothetical protein KAX15_03300, partial [Candidatus Omnitrophica bacterium]|nr:hypothetical protein [Candidatus Omnitrophota bacterium]